MEEEIGKRVWDLEVQEELGAKMMSRIMCDKRVGGMESVGEVAGKGKLERIPSPCLDSWLSKSITARGESTDGMMEWTDFLHSDEFRMFEFKVRKCMRIKSHDWTECPFAHHGEKARRRDPCRFHYSGNACSEFRKGFCAKGDGCDFAHGVFECWLHPSRYRTQLCKDGRNCVRKVCFFAHSVIQLRHVPSCTDASPSKFSDGILHSDTSSSKILDGTPHSSKILDGILHSDTSPSPRHHRLSPHALSKSLITGLGANNLADKLAICANFSDAPSPTSTLVGYCRSPPSSPSPPPISPHNAPNIAPPARIRPLLSPNAHFANSSSQNNSPPPNPLFWSKYPPQHAYLLTSSIPLSAIDDTLDDPGLLKPPQEPHLHSTQAMDQLFASRHQLDLTQPQGLNDMGTSNWTTKSPHIAHIAPSASTSKWASQAEVGAAANQVGKLPLHSIESGRKHRTAIDGKIGKEPSFDHEIPDLGWVNELLQ